MSQEDDFNKFLDNNKSVSDMLDDEPSRKKRKFESSDYSVSLPECPLCNTSIPHKMVYIHLKECLDEFERVYQLAQYCIRIINGTPAPAKPSPEKKKKAKVPVVAVDDDADTDVESPLSHPGYQESPYQSKKVIGKRCACILNDRIECPPPNNTVIAGKPLAKNMPFCHPTKPWNNRENVMVHIGERSFKICRYTHFQEKSMLKAIGVYCSKVPKEQTTPDAELTRKCAYCDHDCSGYYSVGSRDELKSNCYAYCGLRCLYRHVKALGNTKWKEHVVLVGQQTVNHDDDSEEDEMMQFFSQ